MEREVAYALLGLDAILLGIGFAVWRTKLALDKRRMGALAKPLAKHCEKVLRALEPDLYEQSQVYPGSVVLHQDFSPWRTRAAILIRVEFEDESHRKDLEAIVLRRVNDYLAKPGNEELEAVIRLTSKQS